MAKKTATKDAAKKPAAKKTAAKKADQGTEKRGNAKYAVIMRNEEFVVVRSTTVQEGTAKFFGDLNAARKFAADENARAEKAKK